MIITQIYPNGVTRDYTVISILEVTDEYITVKTEEAGAVLFEKVNEPEIFNQLIS